MSLNSSEALYDLCRFARVACGADLVIALEIDAAQRASPVASSPPHHFHSFNLDQSGVFDATWASQPLPADSFRLPTAVVHALTDKPASLLFVPTPVGHAPKSGVLLLWSNAQAALVDHVPLLAGSVATTLTARREAARQIAMRDQFNDLLESVPSGIVLFDGDGQSAVINQRAAELLDCRSGLHRASDLADPMRALRERCDNHVELATAYAAQVGNIDYAMIVHWSMGERTYEVDTHPVNGDGQHGRIWLFTDVTAELRMAAELRGLALSDPLTGLPNRRHFEEQSARIVASADTQARVITVLMADVDHFKRVNDSYGHPIGDEVLKAVAKRCRGVLRDRDLLARFGGEEFIALLATSAEEEAPLVAERLRAAIANAPIRVGDLAVNVSISIGVASGMATGSAHEDVLGRLIAQADAALYRAKQSGRNRIVVSQGSTSNDKSR